MMLKKSKKRIAMVLTLAVVLAAPARHWPNK